MRRALTLIAALALLPAVPAWGQSSQFGINGLGIPGRGLSVRSTASGGAFGFFDPLSSISPASVNELNQLTAGFTLVGSFRNSSNPGAEESGRDTRFPQFMAGGAVPRSRMALGAYFSNYSDRDFLLASSDTILLGGSPVGVNDTLTSLGGLSDLRLTVGYRPAGWSLGAGMHVITGGTRVSLKRVFGDSLYSPVNQRAEISYSGLGFSLGAARSLGGGLAASVMLRFDGKARIERDSTEVGTVDLPVTFGAALRWRASPRLDVASSISRRSWSGADDDLRALGGTGSRNTFEWNAGAEWLSNPRQPTNRPLRLGGHYRTLPFPVESGAQPKEFGLSLGSAMGFARDPRSGMARAKLDLSISRLWRSASGGYREGAWLLGVGFSVRP